MLIPFPDTCDMIPGLSACLSSKCAFCDVTDLHLNRIMGAFHIPPMPQINTLRSRRKRRHFAGDCTLLLAFPRPAYKVWISIWMSWCFVFGYVNCEPQTTPDTAPQWRHNWRDGVSNHQSGADQRKHQTPRHWPLCKEFSWPVNSPYKRPVTRKMFPFDDVIMQFPFEIRWYFGLGYVNCEPETTPDIDQRHQDKYQPIVICTQYEMIETWST